MTSTSSGLMTGKRGLIMGLANDKSLAWGIAQKLAEHGAELAFSYQGEALERRVRPLAAQLGSDFCFECDVSQMEALDCAFATLRERWETIDFLVHAIGFSDKNELRGKYVDTSLENFLMTMNISAYSLVAVTSRARPMMPNGGSILTLSYYGAEKVVPHYNVMGVAKAALETSVKYLANGAAPPERDDRRRRRRRPLHAERPVERSDRRGASRRCRLQPRRHEAGRRAGHRAGLTRRAPISLAILNLFQDPSGRSPKLSWRDCCGLAD